MLDITKQIVLLLVVPIDLFYLFIIIQWFDGQSSRFIFISIYPFGYGSFFASLISYSIIMRWDESKLTGSITTTFPVRRNAYIYIHQNLSIFEDNYNKAEYPVSTKENAKRSDSNQFFRFISCTFNLEFSNLSCCLIEKDCSIRCNLTGQLQIHLS